MQKSRQSNPSPRIVAEGAASRGHAPPADAEADPEPTLRSSRSLLAKALHTFQGLGTGGETGGAGELKAIGDLLSRKLKSSRWTAT